MNSTRSGVGNYPRRKSPNALLVSEEQIEAAGRYVLTMDGPGRFRFQGLAAQDYIEVEAVVVRTRRRDWVSASPTGAGAALALPRQAFVELARRTCQKAWIRHGKAVAHAR